jgi:hypothetical protein
MAAGSYPNEQVLAARHLRICRNSCLVLCSKSVLCGSGAHLRITSRRLRITSRRLRITSWRLRITSRRPPIRATSWRLRITSRRTPIRATSWRLRITRLRITFRWLRITSRRPPIRATSERLVKSNSHHILKNGLCEQARSSVSREPTADSPHVAEQPAYPRSAAGQVAYLHAWPAVSQRGRALG